MRIRPSQQEPPGRAAGMVGTLAVHAAAVAFLMAAVKPTKASPPSYAVDLVAAPAPTTKQRLAREALPTPPPEEKPAAAPAEAGTTAERQASTGNTETTEASQDAAHARTQAATGGSRARAVAPDRGSGGAGTG